MADHFDRAVLVERILLVRLSAIGDIVFASPLVAAFRRAYPDAHIAWLAQAECAPLLAHHPDLDEVIIWPYREWRRLLRDRRWGTLAHEVWAFLCGLRNRRFDLAVDLQGLLKSGVLTRLSGAPARVGLGSGEGSQRLMTRVIHRGGDRDRIGSEYLYLAETLGLPVDGFAMAIHYGARVAGEGLNGGHAVLCPFTTRPRKPWVAKCWAELTRRLQGPAA